MKHVIDEKQNLDKPFEFTVTLNDKTITGVYGEMVFEKGVSTFTLKHGEKKTGLYIPKGVAYKVEESGNKGYEVTSKNEEGIILANTTVIVSFINEAIKNNIPPDTPTPLGGNRNNPPMEVEKTGNNTPQTQNDKPKNNIHEKVETSDNILSNNTNNKLVVNKPYTNTDNSKLDHVPKTGDSSCIYVWIFTAVISFMSFAVFMITRKRRN